MSDCKLSVIIVPCDGDFPPEPCFYSLLSATDGLEAEIFYAHAGLPQADMRAHPAGITFVARPQDAGDTRFVNRLIAQCRGEYVLLLHPDTLVGEDCLRTLCCFMDEHAEEVGAAGVKMLDVKGVFLPESKRGWPSPRALFCRLYGLARRFPGSKRYAADDLSALHPDRTHRVDIVSEAFILINRSVLERTGLLDESFPAASAYADLLYRMSAAGYRQYYVPERILHCGSEASRRGDRIAVCAYYDALSLFYEKHYPAEKTMSALIRLRRRYALLFEKKKKLRTAKKRRLLVFCRASHLDEIKDIAKKTLPGVSHVGLWDTGKSRPAEAVADRRIKMQAYTDIAFCLPDISCAQILLFIDRMTEKSTVYHIYLSETKQFVSCETA
ncbi:MAG: glycosyltransferase [Tannerella sp.]|jgi:GT2 family glycosyltransferase|nr:glycosyltransferase [Tannerella sp.]